MIKVIIISFQYDGKKKISSAFFDLYKYYEYFNKYNYDISIITDVIGKIDDCYLFESYLCTLVTNKKYKDDIIHFYKKLNSTKYDGTFFMNTIENIINENINKYIIIYLGHGEKESMVIPLPQKDKYSYIKFNIFLKFICKHINKNSQLLFILDCCESGDLNLPFKYNNHKYLLKQNADFFSQYIIVITSSNVKNSYANNSISFFSETFIDIISEKFDFENIIEKTNKMVTEKVKDLKKDLFFKQKTNIYTSYIINPILFYWVTNNKYDIVTDFSLSNIYCVNLK